MTTFKFFIGGYMGYSYKVSVNEDTLYCDSFGNHFSPGLMIEPLELAGNKAWDDVLAYLATRKWKPEYVDNRVCDGTHWELIVETETFKFQSNGSNAYPPGFDKFLKLLNLVLKDSGMRVA